MTTDESSFSVLTLAVGVIVAIVTDGQVVPACTRISLCCACSKW